MLVQIINDIFVELEDTFFEEHSFDEPVIVEMSEVCLPQRLLTPFKWSLPLA